MKILKEHEIEEAFADLTPIQKRALLSYTFLLIRKITEGMIDTQTKTMNDMKDEFEKFSDEEIDKTPIKVRS